MDIIPERINLIYSGVLLKNNKTLKEYNIINITYLHMAITDEKKYWNNKKHITGRDSIKMKLHVDFETPCAYTGNYRSFKFDFNENILTGIKPYNNQSSGLIPLEAKVNKFISYLPFCVKMGVELENGSNINSYTYIKDDQMLQINSSIPSNKSGRTSGTFKITLYWETYRL